MALNQRGSKDSPTTFEGGSSAIPAIHTKTYNVKGISHHDLAERLGVWLPGCLGQMVSPRIEPAEDNEIGVECIAVYRVDELLGYINDDDKQEVKHLLQHCKRMPRGRIVAYGEGDGAKHGYRHAWLEVELTFVVSEEETLPEVTGGSLPSQWEDWSYTGPLLPKSQSELKLDQVLHVLREMVRYCEQWSEDVQAHIEALCRHGALDLSVEMRRELSAIRLWLEQMPQPKAQAFAHRLLTLQNNMGSQENRQMHAQRLLKDKMSSAGCLALHLSGRVDATALAACVAAMPYRPYKGYAGAQNFVGKLYYDLLTREKLRQIFTAVELHLSLEEPTAQELTHQEEEAMETFHFIRPEIADEEARRSIHNTVRRLVTQYGVQEICAYLKELCQQKKIMLPQSVQSVYDELTRMGMPAGEKRFDYKTFAKYYNK